MCNYITILVPKKHLRINFPQSHSLKSQVPLLFQAGQTVIPTVFYSTQIKFNNGSCGINNTLVPKKHLGINFPQSHSLKSQFPLLFQAGQMVIPTIFYLLQTNSYNQFEREILPFQCPRNTELQLERHSSSAVPGMSNTYQSFQFKYFVPKKHLEMSFLTESQLKKAKFLCYFRKARQ